MSEKDTIFSGKIKHNGLFDFKELYRFCYVWLTDYGYSVTEKKYSEKAKPDGSKDLEIEWEAKKKISDYFRFIIKITWRIIAMTKTEAEYEGKKVKMEKGDLEISFKAVLEKDYEHRWESSPFLKFLRSVYDRYIIKGRIKDYEDRLTEEVDELIAQAKSFLALEIHH